MTHSFLSFPKNGCRLPFRRRIDRVDTLGASRTPERRNRTISAGKRGERLSMRRCEAVNVVKAERLLLWHDRQGTIDEHALDSRRQSAGVAAAGAPDAG
jgi:hypothetical protein